MPEFTVRYAKKSELERVNEIRYQVNRVHSNGRLPNKSPARNSKKYTKIVVIVFDVVNLYIFFIPCNPSYINSIS